MKRAYRLCIFPATMAVLACTADTHLPEQSDASTSDEEVVQSTTQALTVDSSCSPELAEKIRRMQTELADMVLYAADSYYNDPWSQWALYSFGQPNRGQFQQVVDDLYVVGLTLDADRGWEGGIQYDCRPQGSPECESGSAMASAELGSDPWRVHICDNFHTFQDWGGAEHGYALQRAAILHEFFHLIGYRDIGYCQCAIKYAWSELNARSPDNYQLFITGVNGVPTACEIYQAKHGTEDTHCM